jgi:hypothetical protein
MQKNRNSREYVWSSLPALFPNSAAKPIAIAFIEWVWMRRKAILTAVVCHPYDPFPHSGLLRLSRFFRTERFPTIRSKVSSRPEYPRNHFVRLNLS